MATKKTSKKNPVVLVLVVIVVLFAVVALINLYKGNPVVSDITMPSEKNFEAPGRDWPSEKKVENYFISNLHMTPEEAQEVRSKPGADGKVMLRLRENTTIDGLVNNLEYYGFVRDKEAIKYALKNSSDSYEGKQDALRVGN